MRFAGLETGCAPSGERSRRFFAFLFDAAIILFLTYISYNVIGKPDFYSVREAMDAAQAAGVKNQTLSNAVFTEFNRAYGITLLIAFVYEALTQLLLGGSSVGKFIFKLRIVPQNPKRSKVLHSLLLCVRSALKMLSIYLFQGFPFLICCLSIFTNPECRTGFDMAIKSLTVHRTADY